MTALPSMREFRTEQTADGIIHLIFDMPGRSMNVFSNAAIREVSAFAEWLQTTDVRGVVVRSGKASAFCAGADLAELGIAYDMIMEAPAARRKSVALAHFSPIGRAFRRLETSGKPIAVAINGLALGGGCEFALACHYRIVTDTPQTALGLPESLVGLFPGAGGTQRMPRLAGVTKSLPILLEGARLCPTEALGCGVAHEIVPVGEEVIAAESWIRSSPHSVQPWDRSDWRNSEATEVAAVLSAVRSRILEGTLGHYPAPLAILACLERGLAVAMDEAVAIEIDIFADLIRRPEPRNMIQTLFIAKQDHDKRRRSGEPTAHIEAVVLDLKDALSAALAHVANAPGGDALRFAGFTKGVEGVGPGASSNGAESEGLWFEAPKTETERLAASLLAATAVRAAVHADELSAADRRMADYLAVRDLGFPSYIGGPFALLDYLGIKRAREIVAQRP
jgi:3-hydroxyacyl-CoA dehydrogenase/enoyl-CoA hydratase/3-hydroxybutyryl-CoA epimerase